MPQFRFVAKTSTGELRRGSLDAADSDQARQRLLDDGQQLVSLVATQESSQAAPKTQFVEALFRPRLRMADAEILLEQLAVMLHSGLELEPALREIIESSPTRTQRRVCTPIVEQVRSGSSLSEAIRTTRMFPELVYCLVEVGEQTGMLAQSLERCAAYLRQKRETTNGILAALAYPMLVALAALAIAAYLVTSAIPQLSLFLESMGRKLPAMTQSLMDLSLFLRGNGIGLALTGIATGIGLVLFRQWDPGRKWMDRGLLSLPVIGGLLQTSESQRFTTSLALMLRSGIRLQDALHTAGNLHTNAHVSATVTDLNEKIRGGAMLSTALKQTRVFSPLVASMIGVGERTGDLAQSVEYTASHFTKLLERKLARLSQLVEPAVILTVGGLVGYVYVAFFMALLSAGGNAG